MSEIFTTEYVNNRLSHLHIVILGDSNLRGLYKDIVQLYTENAYTDNGKLKMKGEKTYLRDTLKHGGVLSGLNNSIKYAEFREFRRGQLLIQYHFITRCFNDYVKQVLDDLGKTHRGPDVIVMNSSLWDITRYGRSSIPEYPRMMDKLIQHVLCRVPRALFIWTTSPPISNDCKGGFLDTSVTEETSEILTSKLRIHLMMANAMSCYRMNLAGLDVLDFHYFMCDQVQHRAKDGIHWMPYGYRRMTNVLMTHIIQAFNQAPPSVAVELEKFQRYNFYYGGQIRE